MPPALPSQSSSIDFSSSAISTRSQVTSESSRSEGGTWLVYDDDEDFDNASYKPSPRTRKAAEERWSKEELYPVEEFIDCFRDIKNPGKLQYKYHRDNPSKSIPGNPILDPHAYFPLDEDIEDGSMNNFDEKVEDTARVDYHALVDQATQDRDRLRFDDPQADLEEGQLSDDDEADASQPEIARPYVGDDKTYAKHSTRMFGTDKVWRTHWEHWN
ncbi:MAG: hypothetical protein M1812_006403 [Candelaria pacifica]|nr:MAG: hypothetical protein M1812_006403 [Candelaria pacifica]